MNKKIISFWSVAYLATWCIAPPLASDSIYRVFAILAVFVIWSSAIGKALPLQRSRVSRALFLSAYMVAVSILLNESYTWRMGTYILLITSVLFEMWLNTSNQSTKRLRVLMLWMIVLFCVFNTTTIQAIFNDPTIMRKLVSNNDGSQIDISTKNVGGYGYMYGAILMLPIGIRMLKNEYNLSLYLRPVLLYFVASTFIMAYLSQYFIALLLAVFIAFLELQRNSSANIKFSTFLVIGGLFLIVSLMIEPILDFLIDIVDINGINRKLVEMREILLKGEEVEDSEFGTRFERYTRDVGLIVRSPLWGSLRYMAVGKHSAFLDLLAQYGVLIGGAAIYLIFRPCIAWRKLNFSIANEIMLVLVILGILNPLPLMASPPLFLALPIYCRLTWQK